MCVFPESPAKEDQEEEAEEGAAPSAAGGDGYTRLADVSVTFAKLLTTSLTRRPGEQTHL